MVVFVLLLKTIKMNKISKVVLFLFSFVLARGGLFISPILLANFLPGKTYGAIEWALAAASLGAAILVFGTSSTIPLVTLTRINKGTMAGILAHNIIIAVVCVFLSVISWIFELSNVFSLTLIFLIVVSLQSVWSIHLKTYGRGEASLFLDSTLLFLMALVALVVKVVHSDNSMRWIFLFVGGYATLLLFFTLAFFVKRLQLGEAINYRAILNLGFPLMLASMVAISIIAFGRLVIGYLGGVLLIADYAILARVAALPMIAHQVAMVAKFRHLYMQPDTEMERMIIATLSLVTLSVFVFWIANPIFGWMLGSAFVKAFHSYPLPALWILSQSILWSGISLNDTVNTRQQSMGKVLPWCVAYLIISIPVAMGLIQYVGVSLAHFVYIHGMLMLLFYLTQVLAMYRAGIRLLKALSVAIGSYIGLITLLSLIYS